MKEKLIQLYLYGQSQNHDVRLEIAKQIKAHNKSAMVADTITLNSIFEYMYPKYFAWLISLHPNFEISGNYSIYMHKATFKEDNTNPYEDDHNVYSLHYLNYYADNHPKQAFVSLASEQLEFQVAAMTSPDGNNRYLWSVDAPSLIVPDFTLRKFNFIEKR